MGREWVDPWDEKQCLLLKGTKELITLLGSGLFGLWYIFQSWDYMDVNSKYLGMSKFTSSFSFVMGKTRQRGNTECLKMEESPRHFVYLAISFTVGLWLHFPPQKNMKIPVIDFLWNSISELEENYISVFGSLMLFLMDLGVLLTRHLMDNKEPGGRFSRLLMRVSELWQNLRRDSK